MRAARARWCGVPHDAMVPVRPLAGRCESGAVGKRVKGEEGREGGEGEMLERVGERKGRKDGEGRRRGRNC